ncbi:DUF2797 domain-containing protein [Pontibacter sp. G13]|uniref:DUF2797 domain-containing protein n=1 Tax=Pontibacter sp. G13 TaxID=3074898 RepID=UPI00288A7A21|nr:DUF2797 domain-containing protein [Pontibacter sp. G13]WNJ16804.1 DUF2797 domain-containing protein [Pontibacter sp. G13]
MTISGNLRKMAVELGDPVAYQLNLGESQLDMNSVIGKPISLRFTGDIHCKICGAKTKKSFGQGFCYKHFVSAPENSECIIRPELCRGHLGEGRDPEWELAHHVQPHVVYLAVASGLKVGVTRDTQVPTRWIDQGAWKAIKLCETENRYQAGQVEVALKEHISDKTHWQKMLKNVLAEDIDLEMEKSRMEELLPRDMQDWISDDDDITEISYPVLAFPTKVKSLNLDKVPEVSGTLAGIKGQYWIFDDGRVLNIRKHTGYFVEIDA